MEKGSLMTSRRTCPIIRYVAGVTPYIMKVNTTHKKT